MRLLSGEDQRDKTLLDCHEKWKDFPGTIMETLITIRQAISNAPYIMPVMKNFFV